MDWNWFLSALAQSSAAIVGIFCAFVLTKVINSQASFQRRKQKLRDLVSEGSLLADKASDRHIDWYNERSNDVILKDLEGQLKKEELPLDAWGLFVAEGFSPYQNPKPIIAHIQVLVEAEQKRRESMPRQSESRPSLQFPDVASLAKTINTDHMVFSVERRERERDAIDAVFAEVRGFIGRAKWFLDETAGHPESSRLVSFSIPIAVALFAVGVILPLLLLPAADELLLSAKELLQLARSSKGPLLGIVSALFLLLMSVFLILNLGLRIRDVEADLLSSYCRFSSFSEGFDWRASNESSRGAKEPTE